MHPSTGRYRRTHNTAIVAIPPDRVWEPIQAIRRVHDRKLRRWMPHITLIYPFVPAADFAALVVPLQTILARLEPIEVSLTRIETFRHRGTKYTVWLAPEPVDPWADLHTVLSSACRERGVDVRERRRFVPHLSVGQVQGRPERDRCIAELGEGWRPLRFTVDAVSFISREDPPDDVFRVEKTLRIGRPFVVGQ